MDRIEPEIVLKTTPPRSQKGAQTRERLGIDSPDLVDRSVISVNAPAGFGKTMLLAQWRRELLSRGAVVAWLTLDAHDDGYRFVQGLVAAMSMGSGRQSFAGSSERIVAHGLDELDGLTEWLAEVANFGTETVLILDEADTLPEATAHRSLNYLLRNAPANLRIIIASRAYLKLQVTDLLARGLYLYISADVLRFSVDETMAILSNRFGGRIEPDHCAQLHDITEGWPLGLQLAITSIEKSTHLMAGIAELSACSGDLQRYFVDNLVARLSADQVEFLTCISLLDMVNPSLCAALTCNAQSEEILRGLCNSTPIFAEGVDSDWVRIHPLAREFLQARFACLPSTQRQMLHERAAKWLEDHSFFEEAAREYLKAGRTAQAYETIGRCLYEVAIRGQCGRVMEWIEQIPVEQMESRPRMCLAAAWALAMSERHAEAARLLERIRQDPQLDEEMRSETSAIAFAASYFADQLDDALATVEPWLEKMPAGSLKLQAFATTSVGLIVRLQGQPEKARRIFQRAPQFFGSAELDALRGYCEWTVGMTYLWEGRMPQAETALRDSMLRAEQDIGRRSAAAVVLGCALATALLERGEIQEASTVLANRLDVVERLASPESIAMGFLTSARLAVLQGQAHRGRDLLEALFALGDERGLVRFCIVAIGEQIRLHALHARGDTCQALWRRLDDRLPDDIRQQQGLLGAELGLSVGLAKAYVYLSMRDWQSMLEVLATTNETAERLRRGRDVVQLKLLRALALRESGEDGVPSLMEAISLADEYGLKRIIQDSHPRLEKWAEQVRRENALTPVEASPQLVHAARSGSIPMSVSPSRLLTPKEREVLQLLSRNLSNKQIAQALSVGEETVKWHLKNLFGKFQAGTRKHVVDRAYMLGILETSG